MGTVDVNARAAEQVPATSLARHRVSVCLGLMVGVLIALYAGVLRDLTHLWWTRDDYLHGFLILPLSLFLVWTRRAALRSQVPRPALGLGLAVVLFAGVLLLLGDAGGIITLTGLSLIAMIAGMVLLLFGAAILRTVAFPIAYLGFMIPVLDVVTDPLHWPSQLLTARIAVQSLRLMGFAALLDRQYIVLPWITLEVADVCSGVSYLVSVAAVGLPLAWLTLSRWWAWGTLIGCGLAIAVVANWARVVLIAVLSYLGAPVLHGPLHVLQGMFVAWVGYAALFAASAGLVKLERRSAPPAAASSPSPQLCGRIGDARGWYRSWSVGMVSLGILAVCLLSYDRGAVTPKASFATFPAHLGSWHHSAADAATPIFRVEDADDELVRTYRDDQGRMLHLYVAYLRAQRQGKEIIDYRTARLHNDAGVTTIGIAHGHVVSINRGQLRDRHMQQRIFFWYAVNGGVIADRYEGKLMNVWQALSRGRTNAAIVLVAEDTSLSNDSGPGEATEAFLRDIASALRRHLP